MHRRLLLLAVATVAVVATAVVVDRKDNSVVEVDGTSETSAPKASAVPSSAPASAMAPSPDGKALLAVTNNGVVMPVVGRRGAAYLGRTPCGGEAALSSGRLVGEVQVVLDPGHGGLDAGASTPDGKLTEAVLNLDVAKRTKAVLEGMGIATAMTREADYFVPIERSVEIAATVKPKVFVAIHHNSGKAAVRPTGPGMEIYHQVASADAKRLGGLVWEEMFRSFYEKFKIQWWGASDSGVIYRVGSDKTSDYFGVLRRTAGAIPGVLIEAGFMSNPAEAALMAGNDYRQAEAQAIATGIKRYLTTQDPGSGYQTPNDRSSTVNSGGTNDLCREPKIS